MKTEKQNYESRKTNQNKQRTHTNPGSGLLKKLRKPIKSNNDKSIGMCPKCGRYDASYDKDEHYIECNNCGFFIDYSYEGVNPLPEWNIVRKKDNTEEWFHNWKEDTAPATMDPLEFIQVVDAAENPDYKEIIMDPEFSNLVIDIWDYIKWNNRFSDNDLDEFGKGLYVEYAEKVMSGKDGKKRFVDDLFHGEYDRDNRMEAFIMRDFAKLQRKYGASE